MAFQVTLGGTTHSVEIIARRPELVVEIDGRRRVVDMVEVEPGYRALSFGGLPFEFETAADGETVWLCNGNGQTLRLTMEDPIAAAADQAGAGDEIRAPMPGSVIDVFCAVGDAIARGDTVMTIESMKLQTNLKAPRDGVVAGIEVSGGDTFDKDAVILRLAPQGEE